MEGKIKVFVLEDQNFDDVKHTIDEVLGAESYSLSFACCMKSGVYHLERCRSERVQFDLLLFDVRIIEAAFNRSAYIPLFYKYLGKPLTKEECHRQFNEDVRCIDLKTFDKGDAGKVEESDGWFWNRGGLILWAEFLNLYNSRGWPFKSIIFTAFPDISAMCAFLGRTGIVKATNKLFDDPETTIGEYIKRIQGEKRLKESVFVDSSKLNELIDNPPEKIDDYEFSLMNTKDSWTFKTLFCFQHRQIEKVLQGDGNLAEKQEKIRVILYEIKKQFSRQDLARSFGCLFKTGGTERLTHTNCFTEAEWAGCKSYDGKTFEAGDEGKIQVYLDSTKELNRTLRGISDNDRSLIWDDQWERKLSEVSIHLKSNGDFSKCREYTDWLLYLGSGGRPVKPKDSLLRLDEKREFFKQCIPASGAISINIDPSDQDNHSTVFLPKLSLQKALKAIFQETLTHVSRSETTSVNFKIFFMNDKQSKEDRESGRERLVIMLGHDGTGGFFQSDNVVNRNSSEIGDQDIEKLVGVKCFNEKPGILAFKNWFELHLITKCKDNQFVMIDMFQRKKLAVDEFQVDLNDKFSNYYVFFVSKPPTTLPCKETP